MAAAVISHRRGWRSLVSISNQVRKMSELVQKNVNGMSWSILVKRLEAQGVPSKHAEAITGVLNDCMKNASQSEKMRMEHETEKLRMDIEKLRRELKYELDKVTISRRFDLNSEREHLLDELAKRDTKIFELSKRINQKIHEKIHEKIHDDTDDLIKPLILIFSMTAIFVTVIGEFLQ